LIADRFASAMAALGPFECSPRLAIAVSGGSDSLALALLAAEWARGQGGEAVALTVDHRLRPDSGAEAQKAGGWLTARGIEHHILPWREAEPGAGLQAAAREARYRLLTGWCRDHHILHLLLGHQRDDQAETLMLRLARGSGVDGLAAMTPCASHTDVQLLRPLLDFPREDLRDYLRAQGQEWVEDPSNQAERFDRVRWRKVLAGERISTDRLALTARQLGRARQALEADCAALACEAVIVRGSGYAELDPAPLAAPEEVSLRLLAALARIIGGGDFPPRLDGLERILDALRAGLAGRRTFAGCVFAPRRDGNILVYREAAKMEPPVRLAAGREAVWDNRFSIRLDAGEAAWGALGIEAGRDFREIAEKLGLPRAVLPTLPALMDKRGILAVPPLGWMSAETGPPIGRWGFTPGFPLAGAGFRLVTAPARII
jgi:tRNA(Ile)-lysidine synthase